jgi:hypothetical protein
MCGGNTIKTGSGLAIEKRAFSLKNDGKGAPCSKTRFPPPTAIFAEEMRV